MMNGMTLSVLQLNGYIKRIIDAEELLIGIGLIGEVSNFKVSGGNAYFDLKEEGASIACIMFGSDVVLLENGKQVLLSGRLSFYPKFGKLTFIAKSAVVQGKGALYEQYLALKEKLEKEGLFDAVTKKVIPREATKIGLVTSETGAVLHDIMTVARRKNPKTDFLLYPVKVQGLGAENTICEGIRYLDGTDVDLIIVARGGGSFEDLAPFNTEVVARAIFECNKPIISAVGHETDFSISDFAADLRCATPSVASEVAVFDWYDRHSTLENKAKTLVDAIDGYFVSKNEELVEIGRNIADDAEILLKNKAEELADVALETCRKADERIRDIGAEFGMTALKIEKLNPMALLARGYAVVEKSGTPVKSVLQVENGDKVEIVFADGKCNAKIDKE